MTTTDIDPVDAQLAAAALAKRQTNGTPTRQEAAALKRVERAREESLRWKYYQAIPKSHYEKLSGRPTAALHKLADGMGVPLRGRTVDLSAVLQFFHDFFANNWRAVRNLQTPDDPLVDGPTSSALERYRTVRAQREELALARDRREWVPREDVHDGLAVFAAVLRRAGETLQRQYGPEALDILDAALTDAEAALRERFSDADSD